MIYTVKDTKKVNRLLKDKYIGGFDSVIDMMYHRTERIKTMVLAQMNGTFEYDNTPVETIVSEILEDMAKYQ